MVVVQGGFRDRWTNQSLDRRRLEEPETLEHSDSLAAHVVEGDNDLWPIEPTSEDLDLELFGNSSIHDFDSDTADCDLTDSHVFMQPTPKSRPQQPKCSSELSAGVKRVTDEFSSSRSHKRIHDLKQPWQRGPLSGLFSKPKPFWDNMSASSGTLVGLSDHVTASESDAAIPKPLQQSESTLKRIRASRIVSSDDDFRRLSLARFKTMVMIDVSVTRLGLSLISFAGTLCTDDELSQIFNDVFSPKASGTILKRCNAMWRFSCWLQTRSWGSPFNQDERVVYSYICHLRDSGAGATTPSQFVEALRFSDALLGFCNTKLQDMLSPRVIGATHAAYMTKRVRKPAEVLKVSEIRELEQICMHDDGIHRRIIAGNLLFSFMAAARWHDSMHVVAIDLTKDHHLVLLEALTAKHKSSRTKELQRELLPFTALGHALEQSSWAESWMDARNQTGCDDWVYFLCSWSEHKHDWTGTRMSTAEASCWLRELLEPSVGPARAAELTVHGLKATPLSWAAKSMLFTPDEQLALGHHVSLQHRSALIYSRDNQIGLCTKLHDMFEKLREGTFDPDGNRVQRLFQLTMDRAREMQSEEDDSSSTSSDASSVASSDGEHVNHQQSTAIRRLDACSLDRDSCYINVKSRVVHLELVDQQKFWCGRGMSSSFQKASRENLADPEVVICANCSQAFRSSKA
eukprot:s1851_g10.t1